MAEAPAAPVATPYGDPGPEVELPEGMTVNSVGARAYAGDPSPNDLMEQLAEFAEANEELLDAFPGIPAQAIMAIKNFSPSGGSAPAPAAAKPGAPPAAKPGELKPSAAK